MSNFESSGNKSPREREKGKLKIAVLSFADLGNYGDKMFPCVMKEELRKRLPDPEFHFITPTGRSMDGGEYMGFSKQNIRDLRPDVVILAGGEVIHKNDKSEWMPFYNKMEEPLQCPLPSDIVFGWGNIKMPFFKSWFAVGASPQTEKEMLQATKMVHRMDYVSVRGVLSKKMLEGPMSLYDEAIKVVPDIGWLFGDYIREQGQGRFEKLQERFPHMPLGKNKYVVFQTDASEEVPLEEVADMLLKFQEEHRLPVILLPVFPLKGDEEVLSEMGTCTRGKLHELPADLDVLDIGTLLLNSRFYIGSNLHCLITMMGANGTGGLINKWQGAQLQETMGHRMRLDMIGYDWNDLPAMMEKLRDESSREDEYGRLYMEFMRAEAIHALDEFGEKILAFARKLGKA